MPNSSIFVECIGKVAWITFNRPEKLNAMNTAMLEELLEALAWIHTSDNVHAAVITGNGKGFMAGADIEEYSRQTNEQFTVFQQKSRQMYSLIENNEKPVIAAVNGYALGGGFELVLCCDLVIASEHAKFGLPEVQLALIPGGGSTQRLPRKVGPNRASEMLLLGKPLPAATLLDWGVVNRCVPGEQLKEEAMKWADAIAEFSFPAVKSLKQLAQASGVKDQEEGLDLEAESVIRLFASEEAQQEIRRFARKSDK